MSSILTNMSAMTAVANLNATQKSLAETQNQISSGLKVATAKDNAAYFSIATGMRTQVSNLSAVSDALNLGTSVLGTATSALSTMSSVLDKISADVVTAQQDGTDKTAIQADIKQLVSQLQSAAKSASFNGVNLLAGSYSDTKQATFVSAVDNAGVASTVKVSGSDFSTLLSTLDVTTATGGDQTANLASVKAAITSVTSASSNLGAVQKNIDLQSTFIKSLSDSITSGVGSLVDADMNAASTRLSALQTQQQLGVQALSVANQNSQLILKLFQ